jgi:hypothetical protein
MINIRKNAGELGLLKNYICSVGILPVSSRYFINTQAGDRAVEKVGKCLHREGEAPAEP